MAFLKYFILFMIVFAIQALISKRKNKKEEDNN